jgi:Zn-dependent protease
MTGCPECSTEITPDALSCPQCRKLTRSADLAALAQQAKAAWRVGNFAEERALWQQSLNLLPPDTAQYAKIQARLRELDEQSAIAAGDQTSGGWRKGAAGIGPAILLLLTKGKALLLGLTKVGTLLTMAASLGVYWALYGWGLAIGVIFSIYIHEMGHVIAIRRYGFKASAPMFIPGLGALIRMRGVRLPPIPDSRIGLAGPIYGLGAALAALAIYYATHIKVWGAIAHFGAIVNLFNLIPIWQLDGSRGVRSLTRAQRGIVLSATALLWAFTSNAMLFLVGAVCAYRIFTRDWQKEPDNPGLFQFVGLLAALTVVMLLAPLR